MLSFIMKSSMLNKRVRDGARLSFAANVDLPEPQYQSMGMSTAL